MKIARFKSGSGFHYGELRDDTLYELAGHPYGQIEYSERTFRLSKVQLRTPCVPSKIICLGRNYADHAKEVGGDVPEVPCIFIKPPTTLLAPERDIVYPAMSEQVDYEAELAVVIGERAKDISEDEAPDYIQGYTCLNDVTARDLQRKDGQWTRGKSFDTFCPLGPWVETELDPSDLKVEAKLNGKVVQEGRTGDMIFKVNYIVSFLSQIMTLLPGDVIGTGTPEGIGPMQVGDVIEITVEGIGTLRNKVIK